MNGDEHCCKVCGKCFPCGRSLGGHMRSHFASNYATQEKEKKKKNKNKKLLHGSRCYGLRENPTKTWRLSPPPSSSSSSHDKVCCRECGKCFPSWNSLFGHMRCHSLKSYCSLDGGEAEEEEEEEKVSSSASEFDKEQEDVALCLMMLSRDNGSRGGLNMNVITEFSDKHSIVSEEQEEEGFEKKNVLVSPQRFGSKNVDSDVSDNLNGFKNSFQIPQEEEEEEEASKKKRSRYECQACNKSFSSYQALGGHKASHKRNDFTYLDAIDDINDSSKKKKKNNNNNKKKNKKKPMSREMVNLKINNHQCSICGKVFGSGQALGGHKRSHIVMPNGDNPTIVIQQPCSSTMTELLDLNLPAPTHEEVSNNITNAPWWIGMISN